MNSWRHSRAAFPYAAVLALAFGAWEIRGATYHVGSLSELTTRINAAVAGDVIIVSNGVYATSGYLNVARVGTAANPILIRAETVGGVEITGSHGFSLNSGAAHVYIQGFKFTHTTDRNRINSGATFCRYTRNVFECPGDGNYLLVAGHDARIDRNEFRNKSTVGNMIDVRGSGNQIARRVWIHHNYFHDFTNAGENGAETIRFGLSGLSLSTGDGLIEHNLFLRCRGENEMISNKSSGNTYRYNTVLDSPGAEISQRHGNDCLYYGNYMRNTQGLRIYGDRHKIFNNYLENNSIGITMGNGAGEVADGAELTTHDRPDNNVVAFNTFINNSTHYQMGGRTGGLGSSNTVVANNIFMGGGSMASISSSGSYTGRWTNNIRWQTSSAGNMPASGYSTVNPLLALDASGVNHLQAGSPAINAGRAAFDYYGALVSFASITNDMDGQPRDALRDIGADEFSTAPVTAKLLTTNDVGPFSGLLNFSLTPEPSVRTVLAGAASNVTYTITVTTNAGFTGNVSLGVIGLPADASASFSPATVAGAGSSTLTINTSNNTPAGSFTLDVMGTNSGIVITATASLMVATSNSIVVHLTFDDDTANDSSGYGNHGTLLNGATIVSDPQRGQVLALDGTDDYVDLGNGPVLDLSDNGQATIAAWIKPAVSKNHNTILSKGEWREAYALVIKGDTTPKDQLWTGNDTSVFSGSPVPVGSWAHVAMTINNNLTTYYLNGQLAGAANQNRGNAIDNTAMGVSLGREQYTGSLPAGRWFFNGWMDDVRVYERALTAGEIQSLMVGPPPPTPPHIVGFAVSGSNLVLRGTNGVPGATYYLLTSTNVALPLADWTRIATNTFDGAGSFAFTNAVNQGAAQRFYLLQSP